MYNNDRRKATLPADLPKSAAIVDLDLLTVVEEFEVARPRRPKDESFGGRLRRLRVARGYTESELGKTVGTSHRMIAYYEIQGGNPPADVVAKLAKALGVSADELLGLQPPRKQKDNDGAENLRLMRKLRMVKQLSPKERRRVLQFIDLVVEREALKRAQG
jgi:transcriptional regulator with XRE-family HTH domain